MFVSSISALVAVAVALVCCAGIPLYVADSRRRHALAAQRNLVQAPASGAAYRSGRGVARAGRPSARR